VREVDEEEDDGRHGVADDDPAVGLEAVLDVDVVADVEVAGDLRLAVDVDPLAQVGVLADEDVVADVAPHVEAAVAFGLDVAVEAHPLVGDDRVAAHAELDGGLAADDDVALRHEVVLLDCGPVRNRETVEGI